MEKAYKRPQGVRRPPILPRQGHEISIWKVTTDVLEVGLEEVLGEALGESLHQAPPGERAPRVWRRGDGKKERFFFIIFSPISVENPFLFFNRKQSQSDLHRLK